MSDFSISQVEDSFKQELSYQEYLQANTTPLTNDEINKLEKSYKGRCR